MISFYKHVYDYPHGISNIMRCVVIFQVSEKGYLRSFRRNTNRLLILISQPICEGF